MEAPLEGKSILVVDDDPDIVTAIETVLSDTGAQVVVARDGQRAVDRVRDDDPDLVILDAMLPKRSGFLVLEKIKPNKKRGARPLVIMITANQGHRHETWAKSLGVDAYLNKPFSMDRLREAVDRLLLGE